MQSTNKMNIAELKYCIMNLMVLQAEAIKRGDKHTADICEQELEVLCEEMTQICEKYNI